MTANHAACIPGQCRAGDQWRATGCGAEVDGATWGGGPSPEGGLTEAGRALEYLVAMANGHDYADALKIMDAEHEVRAGLAARSQRPEAVAQRLYEMNGFALYGRNLGDWNDPASEIGRNEYERARWVEQARRLNLAQRPESVTVTEAEAQADGQCRGPHWPPLTRPANALADACLVEWVAPSELQRRHEAGNHAACPIGWCHYAPLLAAEVSGDTEAGGES